MIDQGRLYDRFLVTGETKSDVGMTVPGNELTKRDALVPFLEEYAGEMGAEKVTTAASRFVYHMMRPLLKSNLYLLGRYSRGLDVDFRQVVFESHEEAEKGHEWGINLGEEPGFVGEQMDRPRLRKQVYEKVFGFFGDVFRTMQKATRIPTRTLWDNLAHVTVLSNQDWREEVDSPAIQDQFQSDLESLKGSIEGLDTNTLSSLTTDYSHQQARDGQFVRTTCCLNFRLEEYCAECPVQPE